MIKTRIAPSPTGFFHIGTLRTAYFNYLYARANKGEFIVRIDDTDVQRNNSEYTDLIFQSLEKVGLDFNSTFAQSTKLNRYVEVAEMLRSQGKATLVDGNYYSDYDLGSYGITDSFDDQIIGKVNCSKQDNLISSQIIILKTDGNPTYNFATVVDDIDSGITDVIRGSDHVSNTLRQIFLYKLLDKNPPRFHHLGLLTKAGKKISKRDAGSNLNDYWKYEPEAVLNYVLKLGWNLPDPNIDQKYPLINKELATELFLSGKMRGVSSNVDENKILWLDKKYKHLKKQKL